MIQLETKVVYGMFAFVVIIMLLGVIVTSALFSFAYDQVQPAVVYEQEIVYPKQGVVCKGGVLEAEVNVKLNKRPNTRFVIINWYDTTEGMFLPDNSVIGRITPEHVIVEGRIEEFEERPLKINQRIPDSLVEGHYYNYIRGSGNTDLVIPFKVGTKQECN